MAMRAQLYFGTALELTNQVHMAHIETHLTRFLQFACSIRLTLLIIDKQNLRYVCLFSEHLKTVV